MPEEPRETRRSRAKSPRAQIHSLRSKIAAILESRAELTHHQAPRLESLYRERFGALELERLKTRTRLLEQRRKLELLRRIVNRGEALDTDPLQELERQLTDEATRWRAIIAERKRELAASRARLNDTKPIGANEMQRLKTTYRRLAQQLHPDITGSESDALQRHWANAQEAYRDYDPARLEAIAAAVESESETATAASADSSDIERLRRLLDEQVDRLVALRESPPYCYRDRLRDKKWCAARRKKIETEIESNRRRLREVDNEIATLTA